MPKKRRCRRETTRCRSCRARSRRPSCRCRRSDFGSSSSQCAFIYAQARGRATSSVRNDDRNLAVSWLRSFGVMDSARPQMTSAGIAELGERVEISIAFVGRRRTVGRSDESVEKRRVSGFRRHVDDRSLQASDRAARRPGAHGRPRCAHLPPPGCRCPVVPSARISVARSERRSSLSTAVDVKPISWNSGRGTTCGRTGETRACLRRGEVARRRVSSDR